MEREKERLARGSTSSYHHSVKAFLETAEVGLVGFRPPQEVEVPRCPARVASFTHMACSRRPTLK